MIPSIIIPDARPGYQETVTREEFLQQWREDYAEGRETIPPPENIRFEPNSWNGHWMSIQAARDGKSVLGKVGYFLLTLASVSLGLYSVNGSYTKLKYLVH